MLRFIIIIIHSSLISYTFIIANII